MEGRFLASLTVPFRSTGHAVERSRTLTGQGAGTELLVCMPARMPDVAPAGLVVVRSAVSCFTPTSVPGIPGSGASHGRIPLPQPRACIRLRCACWCGWLRRVESVDGTPWTLLPGAPLRPAPLLSPATRRFGRRRPSATGYPCHSSQWFCLTRALRLYCTARTGRRCLHPKAQTSMTGRTGKGYRGTSPIVPASAVRSPSRRGVLRACPDSR